MSISFENYKKLAKREDISWTQRSGRYEIQNLSEKLIIPDVVSKLNLTPNDSLLEIGCGTGNLLLPLSFLVSKCFGIDSIEAVEGIRSRIDIVRSNVTLVSADFLELQVAGLPKFNKIVIYSVLHYIKSDSATDFVDKALDLLHPGGMLLLGDLPNQSKKDRFLKSQKGKAFLNEWNRKMEFDKTSAFNDFQPDNSSVKIDDSFVVGLIKHCRDRGFDAFILPQNPNLPFGHTREDVLIKAVD